MKTKIINSFKNNKELFENVIDYDIDYPEKIIQ